MNRKEHELQLEHQYINVLSYVEAKDLLKTHEHTAGKIRGAISRYCKKADIERPITFVEMEMFVPDMVDWWLDENPEYHNGLNESRTKEAVDLHLAFTTVWKAKVKNNDVLSNMQQLMASTMLTVKNSLAAALKSLLSYNKRNPKLSQENIRDAFVLAFKSVLPLIHELQSGKSQLPSNKAMDDITRMIGTYMADNQKALAEPSK